jgi:hypothetical protein
LLEVIVWRYELWFQGYDSTEEGREGSLPPKESGNPDGKGRVGKRV